MKAQKKAIMEARNALLFLRSLSIGNDLDWRGYNNTKDSTVGLDPIHERFFEGTRVFPRHLVLEPEHQSEGEMALTLTSMCELMEQGRWRSCLVLVDSPFNHVVVLLYDNRQHRFWLYDSNGSDSCCVGHGVLEQTCISLCVEKKGQLSMLRALGGVSLCVYCSTHVAWRFALGDSDVLFRICEPRFQAKEALKIRDLYIDIFRRYLDTRHIS